MSRNPRYDILFEPVKVGPVTSRNRFYQVPHDLGTGNEMPHIHAGMREVRAEGGWGIVNTGYCSIHPSADDSPFPFCRLWDDEDIKTMALVADSVHKHGALAGTELWWHSGTISNRMTRHTPMSASGISYNSTISNWMPTTQARVMDLNDIRNLKKWYVDAAIRAKSAGFDVIYVYAGMGYGPNQFLSPWMNNRTDEYGGCFENRVRLLQETLTDVKEAVGNTCAVAVRFSTDDLLNRPSDNYETEAHAVIAAIADLPDLFDVKSSSWNRETATARFSEEAAQEPINSFVKPLTDKPVVGVGRFTSPDTMVSQVKRGVLDFIGAARPSIADPFIPNKINEGREDEIRECIGCNICVSCYHDGVPVRCTQNPTMGEEWRRDWHPERIPAGDASKSVLVVGSGAAGLECTRALGQRGFQVTLAEATDTLGGRVTREAALPGLSSWARVRDYRTNLIQTMPNVNVYRDSLLTAEDVLEFGCDHVVIATGAKWSREIIGRSTYPEGEVEGGPVYTPDDIMKGVEPEGPVVIYDFDHYYMGSCLAELLKKRGLEVIYVTNAPSVSAWTLMNNENEEIRWRMDELGIKLVFERRVSSFKNGVVELANIFEESELFTRESDKDTIECGSMIIVGNKTQNDSLYLDLKADVEGRKNAGIKSLHNIGDSSAPGMIAHAVYAGHECARNIDLDGAAPTFKHEKPYIMGRKMER